MGWRETWRETWRELGAGRPGRRFRDFHCRRRDAMRRPQWARILFTALGLALIALGLLLGLAPGLPGFVAALAGTALIASQWQRAARWLDRGELAARRAWSVARGRLGGGPPTRGR